MTNDEYDDIDRAYHRTLKHLKQIREAQRTMMKARFTNLNLREGKCQKVLVRCERIEKDLEVLLDYIEELEDELYGDEYDDDEDELDSAF